MSRVRETEQQKKGSQLPKDWKPTSKGSSQKGQKKQK